MKYITRSIIIFFSAFLFVSSIIGLKAIDHLSFTLSSLEYVLPFIGSWFVAIFSSLILVLIPNVAVSCFKILSVKAFAVLSIMVSLLVSVWLWHNFMYIMIKSEQAIFGHTVENAGELYVVSVILHILYAVIITGTSFLFYQPIQIFIGEKAGRKKQQ